jgi:hypothetical protein
MDKDTIFVKRPWEKKLKTTSSPWSSPSHLGDFRVWVPPAASGEHATCGNAGRES